MSDATRVNGGKRKPPKEGGSNARDRARAAAVQAAQRRKRRNLGILVLAIVVVVAAVGIGIGYATNFGRVQAGDDAGSGTGWGAVSVTPGKPVVLGPADAKTTVTLYEDFRCPHCQEFEQKFGDTLTGLQKDGTIKIELWILPVIDSEDNSDHSLRAGNAFACAAEEGFGQAMYQAFWKNPGKAWDDNMLIDLGNQVADPPSSFKQCVTGLKHKDWVNSSQQAASAANVSGTPAMFINGKQQNINTFMEWTPQQLTDAIKSA